MHDNSWLLFAVGASAVYAVTNFVDKYILEKKLTDSRGLIVYTAIVGFIFGSTFWMLSGFPTLVFWDAVLIILTGMFTIWGLSFYFQGLAEEETSTVIILMQMMPVITLFLSAIFLRERISFFQIIGFILIFIGIIGISVKREHFRVRLSSALFIIFLADIFWAISNIFVKFIITKTNFSQIIAYESFGIAFGGLILYLISSEIRNGFHRDCKILNRKAVSFIFLNELIFVIAKFLSFYAISLGPVSLVSIIGSVQVFFGIFYGWILSIFLRQIFYEKITIVNLRRRILLATIVFMGVWLVQY